MAIEVVTSGSLRKKSRYVHVRDEQWNGEAKIYVDSHDKTNATGIAISRAHTLDRGDETMIFPYDLVKNEVSDWNELYAGYGVSHEAALWEFESE